MKVRLFATYRKLVGHRELDLPAPDTVLSLLETISTTYGEDMRTWLLSPDGRGKGENSIVLVNGRHIEHLDDVATTLSEDDIVSLFPLVAGG